MNKIICTSLTHYINNNQKDWALYYKMVVFAYNTTPSTKLKVSPFYLLHDMEANQPLDNKLIPFDESYNFLKALKHLLQIKEEVPKIIKKNKKQKKNITTKLIDSSNFHQASKF